MTSAAQLYLDLLECCLTNWIYGEFEEVECTPDGPVAAEVMATCQRLNARLMRRQPFDPALRMEGKDWPPCAYTMIGRKRLQNLRYCVEQILADKIPGDLIETGVWRGGATIFMRAILKAYEVSDRQVWVADSFQGLPPPNPSEYPADEGDTLYTYPILAVSLEQVQANFERFGLLDEQVQFLKGWFKDTLPTAPIKTLSVIRLDGDMYESTMDAISQLYPKLSVGGFVIVDDYNCIPACKAAIHDYRKMHNIEEPIVPVDWTGVYWRRLVA